MSEPEFHSDWFSKNIPVWEKYLGHLKGIANLNALEIGSWEGRSAIWTMQNILTGEGCRMVCIDSFQGNPENTLEGYEKSVPEILRTNIKVTGLEGKVTIINQQSRIALRTFPENSFDLIYIDGSHDPKDVLTDIVFCWHLLKKFGVLILDDYGANDPMTGTCPRIGIDAFYYVFGKELIEQHRDWQIIWRKI